MILLQSNFRYAPKIVEKRCPLQYCPAASFCSLQYFKSSHLFVQMVGSQLFPLFLFPLVENGGLPIGRDWELIKAIKNGVTEQGFENQENVGSSFMQWVGGMWANLLIVVDGPLFNWCAAWVWSMMGTNIMWRGSWAMTSWTLRMWEKIWAIVR